MLPPNHPPTMSTQTTTAPAYLITEPTSTTLYLKWGISKAAETYGYNMVTLRAEGEVIDRSYGGNYDMEGTTIGNFICKTYGCQLWTLCAERIAAAEAAPGRYYDAGHDQKSPVGDGTTLYGLKVIKESAGQPVRVTCDGGTGLQGMFNILKALGLKVQREKTRYSNSNNKYYTLTNS